MVSYTTDEEGNKVPVYATYEVSEFGTGSLRISGTGSLTATGGAGSAGIGSLYGHDTMNIYIGGGTIVATGGSLEDDNGNILASGAGIGGGSADFSALGGSFTLRGGGCADNIVISGGTVTATGGATLVNTGSLDPCSGAGIGGGAAGDGSNITISGGTVTATSGTADGVHYSFTGAGIGGGGAGDGNNITISGGIVTANGTYATSANHHDGAGIGGGGGGNASSITITGGTIVAGRIGGSYYGGATGTITITGGSINASMAKTPVNTSGAALYRLIATLQYVDGDSTVNAANVYAQSLVGYTDYNINGSFTDSSGKLYLWLPEGTSVTSVTTASGSYAYDSGTATMGTAATTATYLKGSVGTYTIETEVIGYPKAELIAYSGTEPRYSKYWVSSGTAGSVYRVMIDADTSTGDTSDGSLMEALPDGYTLSGLYLLEADASGNFSEVSLTNLSISSDFRKIESIWTIDGVSYGGDGYLFTMPSANVKIVAVITQDGVSGVAPTITTTSLSSGTYKTAYSETLTASGDAVTWSITDGELPDGLSLNTSTGEISGTVDARPEEFTFTVTATNSAGSDSVTFTIITYFKATLTTDGLSGAIAELSQYSGIGLSTTLTLTITPNDGYEFEDEPTVTVGYATISSPTVSGGVYTYTISGIGANITVSVSGSTVVKTYTVTVADSYATITGAGDYYAGDTVTIYAGSKDGYIFDGWTTDSADVVFVESSDAYTTFTMPTSDVTVTANWVSDGSPTDWTLGSDSLDSTHIDDSVTASVTQLVISGSGNYAYARVANPTASGYTNDTYDNDGNLVSYGVYPTYRNTEKKYDLVFAGWYTADSSYNFTACDSVPDGEAYAKFVDADTLKVGFQYAYEDDTKTTMLLRLVTSVDTLDYKETGFKITITKNNISSTVTLGTEKVYDEITGDSGAYTTKYTASDFSSLSKYLNTVVLEGVPVSSDYTIAVYAYWVTADGTTVVSTLEESFTGKIVMGYSTLADIVSAAS